MRKINKVLVVEDLMEKRIDIRNELKRMDFGVIHTVKCYVDALKLLNENTYDLVVLDMTLPREATRKDELNTHYGKNILFDMLDMRKAIPAIIITRYTYFGDGTQQNNISSSNFYLENPYFMKNRKEDLDKSFDISTYQGLHDLFVNRIPFYAGMIYYNPKEEKWKNNLFKLIHQIRENKNEYTCDGRYRE